MSTTKMKTVPTDADVLAFLAGLENDEQRRDSELLIDIMQDVSGKAPVMWGSAIIGFGAYHYVYASGREGDMPLIAFSPRKGKLALYIMDDATKYPEIRERLGKHTTAKACLYIAKLTDVDMSVLKELIAVSFRDAAKEAAA